MELQPFTPGPTRRFHAKRRAATTTPIPPTLVAAEYEPGTFVDLTFDRAVDATAMDGASVVVRDGDVMGYTYQGVGVDAVSAAVVRVSLGGIEDGAPPGVTLNVASSNGLVALDGAAWSGCSDVALPFG